MEKTVKYECWGCGFSWFQPLGGSAGYTLNADGDRIAHQPHKPPTGCPACGHLYMTLKELTP